MLFRSKSKEMDRLMDSAPPEKIARVAKQLGCRSVAFTYNDPVIFAEYAIDIAKACQEIDIKTVAVTAGYINPEARKDFYSVMDAANVDLKAFTETFYKKLCFAEIKPVLETLKYLKEETSVWFEVTTLLIPDANDSNEEIEKLSQWMMTELGPDVPLHFSAFHPDFKMRDRGPTSPQTLRRARKIAMDNGLRYVYTGNIHDSHGGSTYCPECGKCVLERDWYELGSYAIQNGQCGHCNTEIPGVFTDKPGSWGRNRVGVAMNRFE